jgi:hypothetical protein
VRDLPSPLLSDIIDAAQVLAELYAKLTPQQIQQLQNGTFNMNELSISS